MRPRLNVITYIVLAVLCAPALAFGQSRVEVAKGLVVERVKAGRAPAVKAGNQIITIVRVDPTRYAFRFLTESHEGKRRPLPEWIRSHGLTGGINAGMFLPDGRSCGFLRQKGEVRSDRRPAKFDGVIGFDPLGTLPAFVVAGRGCSKGFGWVRKNFDSMLQGYRVMVDCRGRAVEWPHKRRFSAAGIGVDRDGHAVLVHSRTPYQPKVLNSMLAHPSLGIRGLVYVEGGPEASLFVKSGSHAVSEMGSWEDGFYPSDNNHDFWDLPNIIGFAPR